jgi:meiosis-specific protein HOP1
LIKGRAKFKELVFFRRVKRRHFLSYLAHLKHNPRRALKIFEEDEPEDVSSFAEHFCCDDEVAKQLFHRLETEGKVPSPDNNTVVRCLMLGTGFIEDETSGLMKLRPHHSKKGKTRHSQRSSLRFVAASKDSAKYKDYFNPDPVVERRLLELDLPVTLSVFNFLV